MKKITMFLVLAGFIAGSLTVQEQFVNLDDFRKAYIAQYARFGITEQNWKTRIRDNDPTQDAHIVALGGNPNYNDTPLEIALYAHYCPVADPIPAEADRILPRNNPRLVDRQLGAAVFQEIQVLRFLGDTAAVNRHEAVLQYITGRGNATRAEIETFYRNNIRGLVSQVVDEEFSKAGQDGIVPTQVYANWERQRLVVVNGRSVNGTELIKQVLGEFFLNPTETNYTRVRGISARIGAGDLRNSFNITVSRAWRNMLASISPELESRIRNSFDGIQSVYDAAQQPNDPAFRIFEIPYVAR